MRFGELEKSPYQYTLKPNITLYFSTEKTKDRFVKNMEQRRSLLRNKFRVLYGVYVNTDLIADISAYIKTEKIGFCVKLNGEIVKCQDDIILDGNQMTKNSCEML